MGVLNVEGEAFHSEEKVWSEDLFPVRLKTSILKNVPIDSRISIHQLEEKLTFMQNLKSGNAWTAYVRTSPARLKEENGELILSELGKALTSDSLDQNKSIKKGIKLAPSLKTPKNVSDIPRVSRLIKRTNKVIQKPSRISS